MPLQYCLTAQQIVPAGVAHGIVNLETVTMIFVKLIHLDTLKHLMVLNTMYMDTVNMC